MLQDDPQQKAATRRSLFVILFTSVAGKSPIHASASACFPLWILSLGSISEPRARIQSFSGEIRPNILLYIHSHTPQPVVANNTVIMSLYCPAFREDYQRCAALKVALAIAGSVPVFLQLMIKAWATLLLFVLPHLTSLRYYEVLNMSPVFKSDSAAKSETPTPCCRSKAEYSAEFPES
jgi:hypothetical protein